MSEALFGHPIEARVDNPEKYSRKNNILIGGTLMKKRSVFWKSYTQLQRDYIPLRDFDACAAQRLPAKNGNPDIIIKLLHTDKLVTRIFDFFVRLKIYTLS